MDKKHFQQLCSPYKMSYPSSQHLSCSPLTNEESGVLKGRENTYTCCVELDMSFTPVNADVLCSHELGPLFSIFPKLFYIML